MTEVQKLLERTWAGEDHPLCQFFEGKTSREKMSPSELALDLIAPPEPYHLPGYTGYTPGYKFSISKTFGRATNPLLICHMMKNCKKSIFSDKRHVQEEYPSQEEIDIVADRAATKDGIYIHKMIPRYRGHVPYIKDLPGYRFGVAATKAIAKSQERELKEREIHAKSKELWPEFPRRYKPELTPCPPFVSAGLKDSEKYRKDIFWPIKDPSPYFSKCGTPSKWIMRGFTGHIPCVYNRFGKCFDEEVRAGLCEFLDNYNHNNSYQYAKAGTPVLPRKTELSIPAVVYRDDEYILPGYGGFIPGAKLRCGLNFGKESKGCKKYAMPH